MTAPRITPEEIAAHEQRLAEEDITFDFVRGILDDLKSALSELDRLSAQGGEVPEPAEAVVKDLAVRFGLWPDDVREIARRVRPAPPHPDTVEVSRRIAVEQFDLENIRDNTLNPAHTMTKLGLEECMDLCHKIAVRMLRSAAPLSDTVEVSREDYEYLQLCEAVATTKPRAGCEDFALRWNTWVAAANLMWELVAKRDARRPHPTTNETRG